VLSIVSSLLIACAQNDRNAKYREVDWDKLLNTKMAEWSHEEQKRTDKVKLLQDEVLVSSSWGNMRGVELRARAKLAADAICLQVMDVKKIMLRNVGTLLVLFFSELSEIHRLFVEGLIQRQEAVDAVRWYKQC
jgi:hypothetical protein